MVKLDDNVSGRSEDKNSAKRFSTQLKVIKDLNEHWSIANSTLYQNNKDLGDSVGSFFTDLDHELIDNRLEFLGDYDFEIAGVKLIIKAVPGNISS